MPHLNKERKKELSEQGKSGHHPQMKVCGELNYEVTLKIIKYLKTHKLSYQTCNDIVGALDNAKHEFKRLIQDPYEDLKRKENGCVYEGLLEELLKK